MSCRIDASFRPLSLEEEFADQCFVDVDITADCGFRDWLESNEYPNSAILQNRRLDSHLRLATPNGVLVFAGANRGNFAALLAPPGKFVGLVGRDINPRIKAYLDFNTLLLRIANNLEDYASLTEPINKFRAADFLFRIHRIGERIKKINLTDKVRSYYQKNLNDFATIYLTLSHYWRNCPRFRDVQYYKNENQFLTLQQYARSGNMISTIGPINDLFFLNTRHVSVVDTSNICDYSLIELKGGPNFSPRVILTECGWITDYRSFVYKELTNEENLEFDQLLSIITSCTTIDKIHRWMHNNFLHLKDPFSANCGAIRSHGTIAQMKKYVKKNIVHLPDIPPYNLNYEITRLNRAAPEHIQLLSQSEQIKPFAALLAQSSFKLKPRVYLCFLHLEGWKKAFEEHMANDFSNLGKFIYRATEKKMLEKFIEQYSQENLVHLKQRILNYVKHWFHMHEEKQNIFYESFYLQSGHSIRTFDFGWAKEHAFDDYDQFYRAYVYKNVIYSSKNKLLALELHEQNLVFEQVYILAGSPSTSDDQWGEHHAFEDLDRLNCAIKQVKSSVSTNNGASP